MSCLNSYFMRVTIFLVLVIGSQVQASVYDYPRDANYSVIEYTQSHDMLLDVDPQPLLRIYGDGRVHVHYPVYMKRAGDYQMYLSDTEIQQLLSSLEKKGIVDFDGTKIAKIKNQSVAKYFSGKNIILTELSDDSRSKFKVKLRSYISGSSSLPQYNLKKEVVWKNLKYDAQTHPSIMQLKNASDAEQELRNFLTHRDLKKLDK